MSALLTRVRPPRNGPMQAIYLQEQGSREGSWGVLQGPHNPHAMAAQLIPSQADIVGSENQGAAGSLHGSESQALPTPGSAPPAVAEDGEALATGTGAAHVNKLLLPPISTDASMGGSVQSSSTPGIVQARAEQQHATPMGEPSLQAQARTRAALLLHGPAHASREVQLQQHQQHQQQLLIAKIREEQVRRC